MIALKPFLFDVLKNVKDEYSTKNYRKLEKINLNNIVAIHQVKSHYSDYYTLFFYKPVFNEDSNFRKESLFYKYSNDLNIQLVKENINEHIVLADEYTKIPVFCSFGQDNVLINLEYILSINGYDDENKTTIYFQPCCNIQNCVIIEKNVKEIDEYLKNEIINVEKLRSLKKLDLV